jgi:hypothetical protein
MLRLLQLPVARHFFAGLMVRYGKGKKYERIN